MRGRWSGAATPCPANGELPRVLAAATREYSAMSLVRLAAPAALAAMMMLSACETVGDVVGTGINVELGGASEVPGPGDPDGRGLAEISIVGRFDRLCYELTVHDIDPATAAHIH